MSNDNFELFLPEGVLDFFDVSRVDRQPDSIIFHLEEKNIHPIEYANCQLTSKGFFEPALIQDFPIRGKKSFLSVRRRRWINETSGDIVMRNWDLVAKGTRYTVEFAAFLKAIHRYYTGKL